MLARNSDDDTKGNGNDNNNDPPTLQRVTRGSFLFIEFFEFFFSGYNKEKSSDIAYVSMYFCVKIICKYFYVMVYIYE